MHNVLFHSKTNKRIEPPGPVERFPGQNLLALHRDPLGYLQQLARDYGDIVHFRGGTLDGYFLAHPRWIKEVLVTQSKSLPIGIWQRQARRLLGSGLITSEGDFHLRHRRLIQPGLHPARVPALSRFSADYTARWCEAHREGDVVETAGEFWKLTLNIVAQSLFSSSVATEIEELYDTLKGVSVLASPGMIYFADWILRLPLPLTRQFDRARARLDTTIYRLIEEHRSRPQGDESDLLSIMMATQDEEGQGMSDAELRDETLTLLTAGHGTTSIALMWVFYLLALVPDTEAKLYAELDEVLGNRLPTANDIEQLPFTRAVFAEALRLYPPVWAQDREAVTDLELGGYVIPKGAVVLVSQWVTQRDPRFFDQPDTFLPERWLRENDPYAGHTATNSYAERYSYFPFGVGPRICIGEDYAWMNGMLILATIAQYWRLKPVPGHRVELLPRSGLGARYGMRMQLERRNRRT